MNQAEIEKRFAQINAREPEHLTPQEAAAVEGVSLNQYMLYKLSH